MSQKSLVIFKVIANGSRESRLGNNFGIFDVEAIVILKESKLKGKCELFESM
ncbi:MAG: hypothetical protein M3297_09370 [Thermoproteota archaeon]|nr:hypothetical protein [Thermoproteota archaeon]